MAIPPTIPWLAAVLAALTAVGPFSVDTYLPAFPQMASDLGGTLADVQQTLTAYMATFAIMVLWHGALSDRFGRRPVILISTFLYALASLLCALAPTLAWLWAGRAMQGLCAGAGMVVGRAVIRDLYEGARAQRLMAQMMLIFGIAPAIAPLIGEQLVALAGWRSVFVFLALLGCALTLVSWRLLPETLPVHARQAFKPAELARAYHGVLSNGTFMLLSLALAVMFNGYFLYVVSAPVFVHEHLGLESMGWLFIPAVGCMMAASALSARLAGRWSDRKTITVGFVIMAAASAFELVLATAPVPRSIEIIPIAIYNFGVALVAPNLMLLSLDLFPACRGLASSCQSFLQVGTNALVAGILAPLLWSTPLNLALGAAACYALSLLALWAWLKRAHPAP
jgi:DHA1 family bicyclomycin/chloramphenicol resistance-like MFS transporter